MSDHTKAMRYDILYEYAQSEGIDYNRLCATVESALAQQEAPREPVAKVRVHKTGGNAGIAWSAVAVNDYDKLPLMADGTLLYDAPPSQEAPTEPAMPGVPLADIARVITPPPPTVIGTTPSQEADALDARRYRWIADRFAGMKLSRSENWLSAMGLDPEDADKPLAVIVDATMQEGKDKA